MKIITQMNQNSYLISDPGDRIGDEEDIQSLNSYTEIAGVDL
jgi:hypothetical protein